MITIVGGEVLNHKGTTVTFKLKCDKCEDIDDSDSSISVMNGVAEVTTKECSFCGNNQVIKMKIDLN